MSNARSSRQYLGVRAIQPPDLTIADRAPAATDIAFLRGQLWLDKTNDASYQFSGTSWITLGSGTVGAVVSLTGDAGGAIVPVGGNMDVLGTANEIETTGTPGTITWSLPSTLIAPGSFEATSTVLVGTGLTVTTGGILVSGGDIVLSKSAAAADVAIEVTNSDNTSGASRAGVEIATGGASSGDPYLRFEISGVGASTMTLGLDNSASDLFVISNSTAVGTSNALTLTQAGALTATTSITATLGAITATNGNVVLGTAGNKIMSTSTATTTAAGANSFGKVTLVGGTATIATTSVTAGSIIMLTRHTVGATGAAALGMLTIGTVTAGVSFIINAWKTADATDLAITDVSNISWMIIN
jgi:hypothetical protein